MELRKDLQVFATGVFLTPQKVEGKWVWVASGFEDDTYFDGKLAESILKESNIAEELFSIEISYEKWIEEFKPISSPKSYLRDDKIFNGIAKDNFINKFKSNNFPYQTWYLVRHIEGQFITNNKPIISISVEGWYFTKKSINAKTKVVI